MDAECQRRCNTLQVWYTHDWDIESNFDGIKDCFAELSQVEPTIWYHPEPANMLLVIYTGNIYIATSFFAEECLK